MLDSSQLLTRWWAKNCDRGQIAEWVATGVVWAITIGVMGILGWIFSDIFRQGWHQINWEFITTTPRNAGRDGGIFPILASTALILGVCLLVAVPLGLGTAILLTEFTPVGSRFGGGVRLSLDILAGAPSIVFGLFGNAFFSKTLGLGFSILSGGLTLACMVLPIFIRSTQEGFRSVPDDYRRAAAALGLSRTAILRVVLLPAAIPGIAVGLLLGIGRSIAETAALIFTSGYVDRFPTSLLDSGRSLSIHIYDLATNVPGGEANAYGTAVVLVLFLIIINTVVAGIADQFKTIN
jgi:phosphate transport system permease protein